MQSMTAKLPHRSNAPVTPFAEETQKGSRKVASKKVRQTVDEQQIAELEAKQAAQAGKEQEQATEQAPAPKALTATQIRQQERDSLRTAGLKRCSMHHKYLDRLPDAAKVTTDGLPVEIRPLVEFGKSSSSPDGLQNFCKACDHVAMHDYALKAKASDPNAGKTSVAKIEATIARKLAQHNALAREIDELNARLKEMRDAAQA
jgi:hypothetical protein